MSISIANLSPLAALLFGVLILMFPKFINYLIAFYLIIVGLIGLGLLQQSLCTLMYDLRQQKIEIDRQAQEEKDEADRKAAEERQALADEESIKVREEAEEAVRQIQRDAQRQFLGMARVQLAHIIAFFGIV